ncbi:restriction endonuclease subunit S [Nocardia farcinica]|uniref:restriction endonuclease subunit S n=1 Tax=Nocardia farcinica TaxID=37329 RepID=UPI0018934C63|nr:restriction endonuclease subunit S [Nocardia farcinica]MBF6070025.1 restriction endonuclease subunit S [Nocardia farcinica]
MKYIDDAFHAKLKKSQLRPGDVVTVRTGKPGQTAVVPDWLNSANCSDLVITRPGPDLDARWLSYYLNWVTDSHIAGHLVGAVQQHFNVKSAKGLELLMPCLIEQQAIAEILGALDDKITANGHILRTTLDLADAKFSGAVEGVQLGNKTFDDLANVDGGGTPKTSVDEYWNGDILWATPTDVTGLDGPYIFSTGRTITQDGLNSCASKLYPRGSILMTSRATIGAFALAQCPIAVNQGFIVVNAKEPAYQLWLFHEMRSRVSEFISHANGATFLELSRGRFKKFKVRVPEIRLVLDFSQEAEALHALASQVMAESVKLAKVRDELLPLLMSGKVRVRDAENVVEGVV